MKRLVLRAAAALAAAFLVPVVAHAQLFRTYVSSLGSDANPCTLQQPCRLLPAALAALAPDGEVWILDSANFNTATVNVTKNATIMAVPGQVGSILAIGNAAAISLASGVRLKLRNVNIVNFASNPGTNGIVGTGGNVVILEDSLVSVPGTGIDLASGAAFVDNTTFRDGSTGIIVRAGVTAEVSRSKFTRLGAYGLIANATAAGTASASVSDSTFSGCSYAVTAWSEVASAVSKVAVSRSTITYAFYGVLAANDVAGGSAVVTIGGSSVTYATTAFVKAGSSPAGVVIESQGNNQVRLNSSDVAGGSLSIAPSM